MPKIKINGNRRLSGEIIVGGAKNSAVALIPASILCDEKVEIRQIKKNKYGITFVSYNTSLGEPLFFTHEELAKSSIQILGRVIELRRAI